MNTLHPQTQKALNQLTVKYLSLYRASRSAGTSPSIARWQSHAAISIGANKNKAFSIFDARFYKVSSSKKEEAETVDLIASGYEWNCPNCGHFNKEIEITRDVVCEECEKMYEVEGTFHAYD